MGPSVHVPDAFSYEGRSGGSNAHRRSDEPAPLALVLWAVRIRTVIAATGSHIPALRVPNDQFLQHDFRGTDGAVFDKSNDAILKQFESITGIAERRYAPSDHVTTDLAYDAACDALQSAGLDPEELDGIIVAHNFGDVRPGTSRPDLVPAPASRAKARPPLRHAHA